VLTQPRLDIGLLHELRLPDLARRVWLTDDCDDPRRLGFDSSCHPDEDHHPEWALRDRFLPSPPMLPVLPTPRSERANHAPALIQADAGLT